MKNSLMSSFQKFLCVSTFGAIALTLSACSMKGRGYEPKAEAVMQSKSGSKVKGTLELVDHHGGLIVSGKLEGIRADRTYRLEVRQSGDCSGFGAPNAGAKLAEINTVAKPEGKKVAVTSGAVIGSDGNVSAYAKDLGLKGPKSVTGKALVAVSVNTAAGSEAVAACGLITMKSKADGCCGKCGDMKCGDGKGMGKCEKCGDKGKCGCAKGKGESCGKADCKCKDCKCGKACDCKDCGAKGGKCDCSKAMKH